jgi:hypothetical protein
LFVVDDIADSFDYKNKYAIIQYLEDISEGAVFKQLILTHNFDFFRTVSRRFMGQAEYLMATKHKTGISLSIAMAIKNVFVQDWKAHFVDDNKKKIASIPFMRNLIEFTHGTGHPDYVKLTSLLHWKPTSSSITIHDLDVIYNRLFVTTLVSPNPTMPVIDLIKQEAANCITVPSGVNFEHKIVLSIAIRLLAEIFMAGKIADTAFVTQIRRSQTKVLLKKFEELFPADPAIRSLKTVLLMTPENIHLNAFMYEPILDMSDDHLRSLYTDIDALK